MSHFITDAFGWFPNLRTVEVMDYEGVDIIHTYFSKHGGYFRLDETRRFADNLTWANWPV